MSFFVHKNLFAEIFISDDLSKSLSSLYYFNPKLKYEREILKSKDELLPRAFSEFRPEVRGYYEKGKLILIQKVSIFLQMELELRQIKV